MGLCLCGKTLYTTKAHHNCTNIYTICVYVYIGEACLQFLGSYIHTHIELCAHATHHTDFIFGIVYTHKLEGSRSVDPKYQSLDFKYHINLSSPNMNCEFGNRALYFRKRALYMRKRSPRYRYRHIWMYTCRYLQDTCLSFVRRDLRVSVFV